MAAVIDYIPFDGTLVQNFRAIFKEFISDNLSSFGFVKATDVGQVDWTKIVSANNIPRIAQRPTDVVWSFKGAWTGSGATPPTYLGGNADTNAIGNDLVTHTDGITYQCINTTTYTTGGSHVLRNASNTWTLTAVTVAAGNATYTVSGTIANTGLVGMAVVITGFVNSNNNGTFIIESSVLNTSFTVTTNLHVTETGATASGSTSTNNTSYNFLSNSGQTGAKPNQYTPLLFTTQGWTAGNVGNNVQGVVCVASDAGWIALVNNTGVTTVQDATLTVVSPPPSDLWDNSQGNINGVYPGIQGHWTPYLYEVWKTNDGLQPVYFRFVYGVTQTTGLPWIAFTAGNATNGMGYILNSCTSTSRGITGCTGVGALNLTNDANTSDAYMHAVTASSVATNLGFTNSQCLYESIIAGSAAEGWFTMCLWRDSDILAASTALTAHTVFAFERARTVSGAPSDEYWSMWISGTGGTASTLGITGGTAFFQTVWKTEGSSARTLATAHPSALGAATVLFNGESPLFPLLPLARGYLGNPMTTVAAAPRTDFSIEGQLVTGSSYGTVHTYMILQSALGTGGGFGNVVANYNLALRFD